MPWNEVRAVNEGSRPTIVSAASASLYIMTSGVTAICLALVLLPAAMAIHRIKPLELLRDASA